MIMFGVVSVSLFMLLIVLAGPSLLTLSPTTYRYLTLSHLLTFLFSVLIFVFFGRYLKQHGHPPFWPGVLLGSLTAFASSLIYQYIIRLPRAQLALLNQLHGVPKDAAVNMLHLHVISGALITSAFAAGFYGLLGGFASWWGGWPVKPPPNGDNTSKTETRAS